MTDFFGNLPEKTLIILTHTTSGLESFESNQRILSRQGKLTRIKYAGKILSLTIIKILHTIRLNY
jgi:hypothetical protein